MSTPTDNQPLRAAQLRFDIASDRYAEAVADALGVNRSDLRCLRALSLEGPLTAGALSEKCGLTTGAVTGILDRLERLSLVKREADPLDRRRVVAQLHPSKVATLEPLLLPGGAGTGADALAVLLEARAELLEAASERVRADSIRSEPLSTTEGFLWAALAGRSAGVLEVIGGSMHVSVAAGAPENELFRATIDDRALRISERDGHIRLEHRSRWSRGRPEASIALNRAVRWSVRLSGGSNDAEFDLTSLSVSDVEVKGGSSRVSLDIGELSGRLPARITGGSNKLTVRRPASTAVTVSARGLATIDYEGEHRRLMGDSTWHSPDGGPGSLDFLVKGGANVIRIEPARITSF